MGIDLDTACDTGLKNPPKTPANWHISPGGGAKSDARGSDLAELIASWDRLPAVIRMSILAMVKAVRMSAAPGV